MVARMVNPRRLKRLFFTVALTVFSISRHPNMAQVDEMMAQLASLELGGSPPLLHSD